MQIWRTISDFKIIGFFIMLCSGFAFALNEQDGLNVLNINPNRPQTEEMMRRYLRRLSSEAFARRLEKLENLKTVEQIARYQQEMRAFFLEQLDLPKQKTPLNARIISSKSYPDYRLEKVMYESQPDFFVPALLYLPKTDPPYPGVLLLCGHLKPAGKEMYQKEAILFAKNGIAALCPDPIGQGERRQILNSAGEGNHPASTEHLIAGVAPILLGRNLATYMIWDAIRGIDYLQSRSDIDPDRIGCTGHSGGGNRTSYLMALDERIVCAAPAGFITTTWEKIEQKGPGDAEQNIHAQIAYGMDIPDYIIMRAPKPTVILSTTRDDIPITGTWDAFRQGERIYTKLGFSERVDIIEADDVHTFSLHLREGVVRWMRRWLLGIDDAIEETECPVEPIEALRCTPDGQVLLMPGARSANDLYVEREKQLAAERRDIWGRISAEEKRDKIRQISGIRKLNDLPEILPEYTGRIQRHGYQIDKLILQSETDILLPALLFVPERANGERILYLHGSGKQSDALPGGVIEKQVLSGKTVLAVDVRGVGETKTTPWHHLRAREFIGTDAPEFFIAYMLNKSFTGMRAEDILVSARFFTKLPLDAPSSGLHVIAVGETGPPAMHAAALQPELFKSVTIKQSLISWSNVVRTPVTKEVLNHVVHGALQFYDLPDLKALAFPLKVQIQEPIDAMGKQIMGE